MRRPLALTQLQDASCQEHPELEEDVVNGEHDEAKVEQAKEEVREVAGVSGAPQLPHLRQQHHHQQPGCTEQPGDVHVSSWDSHA